MPYSDQLDLLKKLIISISPEPLYFGIATQHQIAISYIIRKCIFFSYKVVVKLKYLNNIHVCNVSRIWAIE